MDIDLLSKMVKELILDQDRVVLPGLGSFVAEVVPSTFSDKGYTINPPYRRLFFRSKPDEGDDLTSFYASSNNVELDLADRIIKEFISELKSVLHEKKTVVFPGLGRLRATKENHVFFVADESLDIYPAGFGLEPISLKTHQETAEEVAAAVEGLKTLLKEPTPAPEPAPAPVPEPAAVPEPMPDPAPQLVPPAAPAAPSAPGHVRKSRTGLRLSVGLAAAAAVLLVAYMIIGRTRPDLVDPFLYTPEELEIVKML
jgi:nucleoid DNA-binding protein